MGRTPGSTTSAERTEELVHRGLLAFGIPEDPSQAAAIAAFVGGTGASTSSD
jgi:hypothetical protein